MGLTIHYEGHLKSSGAYDELIQICQAFSEREAWPAQMIEEPHKSVEPIIQIEDPEIDNNIVSYEGPVRGIRLYPDPDCEPLTFEFGTDLFCQDWTKTQFAGPEIHRKVVTLLTHLKDLFFDLKVIDESDYWTERDDLVLGESFRRSSVAIDDYFRQHSGGRLKVKTPDGRFIDIIT